MTVPANSDVTLRLFASVASVIFNYCRDWAHLFFGFLLSVCIRLVTGGKNAELPNMLWRQKIIYFLTLQQSRRV